MERALITEFETLIDELLAGLRKDNVAQATELAAAWMDIRGYGPVKEESVREVRQRIEAARATGEERKAA